MFKEKPTPLLKSLRIKEGSLISILLSPPSSFLYVGFKMLSTINFKSHFLLIVDDHTKSNLLKGIS